MGAAGMTGWPCETLMHDEVIPMATRELAERLAGASPQALHRAPLIHDHDLLVRWADWLRPNAPGVQIALVLLRTLLVERRPDQAKSRVLSIASGLGLQIVDEGCDRRMAIVAGWRHYPVSIGRRNGVAKWCDQITTF